ncbi:hypothetical protein JCM11641_000883 [Rhodosporidiobolus odoratus]
MLFQVSKDFSALSAPYLFKVLKASKVDLRFKCSVAPSRFALFRTLDLDSHQSGDVLPFLPRLTGVHKLIASHRVFESLWGHGAVTFDEDCLGSPMAEYAASGLKRLSPQIQEVEYRAADFVLLLPFARIMAHSLQSLLLTLESHSSVRLTSIASILSTTSCLQSLSLICGRPYAANGNFDLSGVTASMSPVPPLQDLSLKVHSLESSHIAFAAAFSGTLVTLSLDAAAQLDAGVPARPQPQFTTEIFPLLTSLSLAGNDDLTYETFGSIGLVHVPNVTKVQLNIRDGVWSANDSPLASFVTFPQLDAVKVMQCSALPDEIQEYINNVCDEHGLTLLTDADDSGISSLASFNPPDLTQVDKLKRTLSHLLQKVDEADETGESMALSRIETALRPLEVERIAAEVWRHG